MNDFIDYSALAYKKNLIFIVYDRYGNKLYEAGKMRNFTWDGTVSGKKVLTGTYWYTISWNENNKDNTETKYSGWVLVKTENKITIRNYLIWGSFGIKKQDFAQPD